MYALLLQYNVFRFHSVLMGRPLKVVFDYISWFTLQLNLTRTSPRGSNINYVYYYFSSPKKKNPKNRIVFYGFL